MGSGNLAQAKRNVTMGRRRIQTAESLDEGRALARLDAYDASIFAAGGNARKALRTAESAVELALEVGEEEALARALGILDWANVALGNDVPRRGEEAIEIYQRIGKEGSSVNVMNNLGMYEYWDGNWDAAVSWYQLALEASERAGNVFAAGVTRTNIAEVLIGQRRFDEARSLLVEARRTYESSNSTYYMPWIELLDARVDLGTGRPEKAVSSLTKQLENSDNQHHAWLQEMRQTLGEAMVAAGDRIGARRYLLDFKDELVKTGELVPASLHHSMAKVAMECEEYDKAREYLTVALEHALQARDSYQELMVIQSSIELARLAGSDSDPADLVRKVALETQLGVNPLN